MNLAESVAIIDDLAAQAKAACEVDGFDLSAEERAAVQALPSEIIEILESQLGALNPQHQDVRPAMVAKAIARIALIAPLALRAGQLGYDAQRGEML
jgi:hypothetical protein